MHSHSPCSIYQSKWWDEATSHWNPTKPSQRSKVLAFSPIGENFRRRVGKHSWQSCVVLNDLVRWMYCSDQLGIPSRFECSPRWWIAAPSIGHSLRTKSFHRIVTLKQCPCPFAILCAKRRWSFFYPAPCFPIIGCSTPLIQVPRVAWCCPSECLNLSRCRITLKFHEIEMYWNCWNIWVQ